MHFCGENPYKLNLRRIRLNFFTKKKEGGKINNGGATNQVDPHRAPPKSLFNLSFFFQSEQGRKNMNSAQIKNFFLFLFILKQSSLLGLSRGEFRGKPGKVGWVGVHVKGETDTDIRAQTWPVCTHHSNTKPTSVTFQSFKLHCKHVQ